MTFDPLRGEATKGQEIVQLSVKESLLLELLIVESHGGSIKFPVSSL